MPKATNVLSQFLLSSEILIKNGRNVAVLSGVLREFGYDETRWAQGLELLTATRALSHHQVREAARAIGATDALRQARRRAHAVYARTLTLARVAFDGSGPAATVLGLRGPRKKGLVEWFSQAEAFYAGLRGEWGAGLAPFGFTPAKIAAEADLVQAVRLAHQEQGRCLGDARQATVDRDRQAAELARWTRDLRTVARVAFTEAPQHLEMMGLTVRR